MNEMTDNPDYRLVMDFLQSINPGDMGEESAEQLMQIGQRIEGGGQLSDQEREMFMSVVGAMPDYSPANNFGSMSEAERELAMDQALPTNLSEEERQRFMEQKYAAQKRLEFDARQREIQAGNFPTGEAAGMVEVPQMQSPRPRMRPSPRMSPSPRMRPDNLGG